VHGGRVTPHWGCERVRLEVRPRGYLSRILDPEKLAVFVYVEGREQAEGGSRWNVEEVEAARDIVRRLLELGVARGEGRSDRDVQGVAEQA